MQTWMYVLPSGGDALDWVSAGTPKGGFTDCELSGFHGTIFPHALEARSLSAVAISGTKLLVRLFLSLLGCVAILSYKRGHVCVFVVWF